MAMYVGIMYRYGLSSVMNSNSALRFDDVSVNVYYYNTTTYTKVI